MKSVYYAFILTVFCCVDRGYATMCKPLSKFRIDCNDCYCSEDGTQYSCTKNNCFEPPTKIFQDDSVHDFVLANAKKRVERDSSPIDNEFMDDSKSLYLVDNTGDVVPLDIQEIPDNLVMDDTDTRPRRESESDEDDDDAEDEESKYSNLVERETVDEDPNDFEPYPIYRNNYL